MAGQIQWNPTEFNKLARTAELEQALLRIGGNIAQAAGPGVKASSRQGRDRVRVTVRTTTFAAAKAEAEDRTLTRAVDAGRV